MPMAKSRLLTTPTVSPMFSVMSVVNGPQITRRMSLLSGLVTLVKSSVAWPAFSTAVTTTLMLSAKLKVYVPRVVSPVPAVPAVPAV